MEKTFKFSEYLSKSDIIPKHFQNKPANVFIACQMAQRMQVPAMEVMQNLFVVHGNPCFKTPYLIARAAESGVFSDPIQFRISGEGLNKTITAYSVLSKTKQLVEVDVSMQMAIKEGWTKTKKDRETGKEITSKYESMPDQMLCYRAAAFLIRRYCPEASLGFPTREEIEDTEHVGQIESEKVRSKLNAQIALGLQKTDGGISSVVQNIGIKSAPKETVFEIAKRETT